MVFKFSKRSEDRLEEVHPDIAKVIRRTLEITPVDFSVIEGKRSVERQTELVNAGASQTMDSRHITGHAIDIAPYIGGRISWDWPPFYILAEHVKMASEQLDISVRWGGCWMLLSDMEESPEEEVAMYVNRKLAQGRVPFSDGPHYELPKSKYN